MNSSASGSVRKERLFQFGPNGSAVVSAYPVREFRLWRDLGTALNQTPNFSCAKPNMWFQKISIPPPQKGSHFSGGRGASICLIFQWGGGVTIGKYFQRVLVTRKRVTKKKHKNLPRQFICEDIKHDES